MSELNDPIHEHGKHLEDLFFKRQDAKLLEKIRSDREAQKLHDHLASATGIDNADVIDALLKVGVTAESMTSLAMIPLVAVAWADKTMEDGEVDAILSAANSCGIPKDTGSYELLNSWLKEQPEAALLESWKKYVSAVLEKVDSQTASQLKTSVLDRAIEVAEAAGGFLGLGNKVSPVEQQVIEDLASVF